MRKAGALKRILSMALLLSMVFSLLNIGEGIAEDSYGYIIIENDSTDRTVMLRPAPGSTDYNAKLPEGQVMKLTGTKTYKDKLWYQVEVYNSGATGYILGNFVHTMTADQLSAWTLAPYTIYTGNATDVYVVGPNADGSAVGYVRTFADDTPVYGADRTSTLSVTLANNTVLAYYKLAKAQSGYEWVQVKYMGQEVWLRSDNYIVTTEPGDDEVTPTPTPTPEAKIVITTVDKVILRKEPKKDGAVLNQKDLIPLNHPFVCSNFVAADGFTWAEVTYKTLTGYIRSDCYAITGGETEAPVTDPPVTPVPTGIQTGSINTDKVFFRSKANTDCSYWSCLPIGWTLEVLGKTDDGKWYKVSGNTPEKPDKTYTGYVMAKFLTLSEVVTPEPTDGGESDYALITVDGTVIYETPGGKAVSAKLSGTVVNLLVKYSEEWYLIEIGGVYGYVNVNQLRVLKKSELSYYTLPLKPAVTDLPTPIPVVKYYILLVKDKVNLRATPDGTTLTPTNAEKMPYGTVLECVGAEDYKNNYYWMPVNYNGKFGYVRSDCYKLCDENGKPVTVTPTPTPEPGVTPDPGETYIRLIKGGVNFRQKEGGTVIGRLDKGTVLPYYAKTSAIDGEWYYCYSVKYGAYGYIMATMAKECDKDGKDITVIITPKPDETTTAVYTYYACTSLSSVWLRTAPSAKAATDGKVDAKGTVLPMTGAAVNDGTYTWLPVITSDGRRGYLRGDCAFQMADWQLDYYKLHGTCPTPTPAPATPRPGNSDYIITTAGGLWVRETTSTKANTVGKINNSATVLRFYGQKTVSKITWYKVKVDGKDGWVHGSYARILTNAEYDLYKGKLPTPTPTNTPAPLPDESTWSDLAITTNEKVKIRSKGNMSGSEVVVVPAAGTVVTYLGSYTKPTVDNPYYWFNIKWNYNSGWMRGDMLRILTKDEKKMYELTGDPDAPKEASYTTLKKGSIGDAVTRLQQELVAQGYLAEGSYVNAYYDTATENAIINFQKANKLTQDGIAGESTQHKLFNTVPEGYYTSGSVTPDLKPVEYSDWFTGDIQKVWKVNTVAIVTDVYTGISWRAQLLYGDNHADVEPKTVADTEAYCKIYGVTDPQDISDREQELQSYRRRPLWVTVGGRTFAASLYGIPHNFVGDRIADNNFNGQVCIHFTNSRTHGTDIVDVDASYNGWFGHQSAIKYAYMHSKSGNK